MRQYMPGFRIIKTALAVTLCLLLGKLFDYGFPFYASLACILMMKETADLSLKFGIHRCIGTAFGGIMSIAALYLCLVFNIRFDSYLYIFVIGFTLLFSLSFARVLKMPEYAMSMTGILVVIILCNYNLDLNLSIMYSVTRVLETMAGIAIAVVVNTLVHPIIK